MTKETDPDFDFRVTYLDHNDLRSSDSMQVEVSKATNLPKEPSERALKDIAYKPQVSKIRSRKRGTTDITIPLVEANKYVENSPKSQTRLVTKVHSRSTTDYVLSNQSGADKSDKNKCIPQRCYDFSSKTPFSALHNIPNSSNKLSDQTKINRASYLRNDITANSTNHGTTRRGDLCEGGNSFPSSTTKVAKQLLDRPSHWESSRTPKFSLSKKKKMSESFRNTSTSGQLYLGCNISHSHEGESNGMASRQSQGRPSRSHPLGRGAIRQSSSFSPSNPSSTLSFQPAWLTPTVAALGYSNYNHSASAGDSTQPAHLRSLPVPTVSSCRDEAHNMNVTVQVPDVARNLDSLFASSAAVAGRTGPVEPSQDVGGAADILGSHMDVIQGNTDGRLDVGPCQPMCPAFPLPTNHSTATLIPVNNGDVIPGCSSTSMNRAHGSHPMQSDHSPPWNRKKSGGSGGGRGPLQNILLRLSRVTDTDETRIAHLSRGVSTVPGAASDEPLLTDVRSRASHWIDVTVIRQLPGEHYPFLVALLRVDSLEKKNGVGELGNPLLGTVACQASESQMSSTEDEGEGAGLTLLGEGAGAIILGYFKPDMCRDENRRILPGRRFRIYNGSVLAPSALLPSPCIGNIERGGEGCVENGVYSQQSFPQLVCTQLFECLIDN